MEIVMIAILLMIFLTILIGLIVVTRSFILIKEDIQILIKAMTINATHNKRGADCVEKIAKLS